MNRAIIAEKASLASERAKEFISSGGSIVSRARSLVSGDAQFFAVQPKPEDLRRHLNSDCIHEKSVAMKRIIAQMCKGYDMSTFFADVVKNIHSPSVELRKLIYFFVTHYAEERPNEALLSISAFQKDLMDHSMHVRSLALRMLSAMRIPAIHTLVMVAVQKCALDTEPLVRKTAAISLAQVYAVNGSEADLETIYSILQQLLADKNSEVAAAAALSFVEICPHEVSFIHKVYRNLCRVIGDCDEWGQVVLIHVLLRYARTQFCDPNEQTGRRELISDSSDEAEQSKKNKENDKEEGVNDANDGESSSETTSSSSSSSWDRKMLGLRRGGPNAAMLLDSDHRLLLDSVKPLLMSLNSAVVVAATAVICHCGPKADMDACTLPLLRLLAGPDERHSVVLSTIHTIVLTHAEPFVPYIREFFLMPQDKREIRILKLSIISKLATANNFPDLFREFRHYTRSYHVEHVVDAVRGLGLIAVRLSSVCTSQVMRVVLPLLSHKNAEVVSESIKVLQLLVVQGNSSGRQTARLVYRLLQRVIKGEVTSDSAKAVILWLVGENIQLHNVIAAAAPECFRILVKSFKTEGSEVRKQVLMLGCKIWMFLDGSGAVAERFRQLFFYLIELANFDDDYDVRDYARLVGCAVDRQSATFEGLKRMLLFREKKQPQSSDPYAEHTHYELGSLSHFIGKPFTGYHPLPPWATVPSDPLLRLPPGCEVRGDGADSGDDSMSDDGDDDDSSMMYSDNSSDSGTCRGSGSSDASTSVHSSYTGDDGYSSTDGSQQRGGNSTSDEMGRGDDEEQRTPAEEAVIRPSDASSKTNITNIAAEASDAPRRPVVKVTVRRLGAPKPAPDSKTVPTETEGGVAAAVTLEKEGSRSGGTPGVSSTTAGNNAVREVINDKTTASVEGGSDRALDTPTREGSGPAE
ncbi:AP-3 complex subunit beta [Trypanosoma equiperdum]|uniref:AP-3 complex subunit beta n=1 Tax=Trypanosoma equiperdum TaxID=5694 RepID=A0A1G4IJT8_TRYEQ|nr:AP-3 complex subunit beta [Trypanosoma equiperdum]